MWRSEDRFAALRDYITVIERAGHSVPLFDPTDGGPDARVLLVMEAPGTMADSGRGSGFVSVDNNDQTASNCWRARSNAGLVEGVIQWNIVPWHLGVARNKPSPVQIADGAIRLRYLLDLLPNLHTVVLCGEYAKHGWRRYVSELIDGNGPDVIETWHPSPTSLNFGSKRTDFIAALRRAALRV